MAKARPPHRKGHHTQQQHDGGHQQSPETRLQAVDHAYQARILLGQLGQGAGAQFGQQINLQQGMALGLDRKVLQSVITRAALDNEAARIGLSAGDAVVASEITSMAQFQGTTGSFDRETYRFTLQQNNLTEADFENGLRGDIARSLLQGAIVGGFETPAALTDPLFAWAGERRGFSMLRLTEADLPAPLRAPTEAELSAYHDAKIDTFTRPEAKRLTYAALLPSDLAKDMPVDEAALKDLYQARIAEFVIPEKRLVERLVYGTEDEAKAIDEQRAQQGPPQDPRVQSPDRSESNGCPKTAPDGKARWPRQRRSMHLPARGRNTRVAPPQARTAIHAASSGPAQSCAHGDWACPAHQTI